MVGRDLEQMLISAARDRFDVHEVSGSPSDADLVLFVETLSPSTYRNHYFQHVRKHPVYRQFRAKSYLFASADKVVPFLPGVYASIERRWYSQAWTRSGHYLGVKEEPGWSYDPDPVPTRLFSFVGSACAHRIRARVMELRHPDAFLVDTDAEQGLRHGARPQVAEPGFRERYLRSIVDSAFVLCPRGGGTSTFRLFETMMLGRVPVILSDQWVPPDGPDWDVFSLRVRESDVRRIPTLLEAKAADASSMGRAARAAWVDWFSEPASFHRTVEWCLDLARLESARAGLRRYVPSAQMLRPYHVTRRVAKHFGFGYVAPGGLRRVIPPAP